MKYYKLTDQNMCTHNGFQWMLGEWREATGDAGQGLCTDSWLHCYDSPLLAMLHNPIHAEIDSPRLFEIEVEGETKDDGGMKRGFRKMRLVVEIPLLPKVDRDQAIVYAILCARAVCVEPSFIAWADKWLSGEDRSTDAWAAASDAASDAAWAARAASDAASDAASRLNLVEIAEKAMAWRQ